MKTINILSSHSTRADNVTFVIDAEHGDIRQLNLDLDKWDAELPATFDVDEYKQHYGHLNPTIDILDIGYTTTDGHEAKPEPDYRLQIMRAWYVEAMQHLDHLAAAMENVLLHQGSLMTPADRKSRDDAAHAAREFQHRISYRAEEDEDEDDKAKLPYGHIIAKQHTGECSTCGREIQMTDTVLMNTHTKEFYCNRECLDKKLNR